MGGTTVLSGRSHSTIPLVLRHRCQPLPCLPSPASVPSRPCGAIFQSPWSTAKSGGGRRSRGSARGRPALLLRDLAGHARQQIHEDQLDGQEREGHPEDVEAEPANHEAHRQGDADERGDDGHAQLKERVAVSAMGRDGKDCGRDRGGGGSIRGPCSTNAPSQAPEGVAHWTEDEGQPKPEGSRAPNRGGMCVVARHATHVCPGGCIWSRMQSFDSERGRECCPPPPPTPCLTFHPPLVSFRGPGQSPVLPFAECVSHRCLPGRPLLRLCVRGAKYCPPDKPCCTAVAATCIINRGPGCREA